MKSFQVNIFNQNRILTKIIRLLVDRYSKLSYDRKSGFGTTINNKRKIFMSNSKFNWLLVKNMSAVKISRVLHDIKIIDNIQLILSMKYSLMKKLNHDTF
jgi:abortive infection bacteriophage resistance protein